MTAKQHLEWCIDRALEYYDAGNTTGAMASFMSDVSKHEGTAHIQSPVGMMIINLEVGRGRSEFVNAMRGFAVIEAPARAS